MKRGEREKKRKISIYKNSYIHFEALLAAMKGVNPEMWERCRQSDPSDLF